MKLDCYVYPGWNMEIRPGQAQRDWMDHTNDAYAYRCLPLSVANQHGWEILNPATFEACWTGGPGMEHVEIRMLENNCPHGRPVSLFGHGTLTFHIYGLFRTEEGINLHVGGAPNTFKDGIVPLTAMIETDWSPYSFTMNHKFTRPHHWVRFEKGEPICFIMPIQRGLIDRVEPKIRPVAADPDLRQQYAAWSCSRDAFNAEIRRNPPAKPADCWQKRYYRGINMHEQTFEDHQVKLHVKPFTREE